MKYGLKDTELQYLQTVFAQNSNIEKVILYGSRAKGCHKPFSDVDITLVGSLLTRKDANRLHATLDESTLPYMFDISIFSTLKSEALIEHIKRVGIVIYNKDIQMTV